MDNSPAKLKIRCLEVYKMSEQIPYQPPSINQFFNEFYEIPFAITVAANSQDTFVSSPITFKYRVEEVKTYFPDDAINAVLVYWLLSTNAQGSTTTIPNDDNLLAPFEYNSPLSGHAGLIALSPSVPVNESKTFIKMHVVNNNAYPTTILGTVRIMKA